MPASQSELLAVWQLRDARALLFGDIMHGHVR